MPFDFTLLRQNAKKLSFVTFSGTVSGYYAGYAMGQVTVTFLKNTLVGTIINYATGYEGMFSDLSLHPSPSDEIMNMDKFSFQACFAVFGAIVGGAGALASTVITIAREHQMEDMLSETISRRTPFLDRLHKIHYSEDRIPQIYRCPISKELMEEPVFFKEDDGTTYDKPYIELWLSRKKLAPHLNKTLTNEVTLFGNGGKKREIEQFVSMKEREYQKKLKKEAEQKSEAIQVSTRLAS